MENIIKMPHIKFKPTRRFAIDFNPRELNKIEVPEESKIIARKYLKSNELNDGAIMLLFENEVIYGFDYLYQNKKLAVPEINPVTIFFSNAVMSHRLLIEYKKKLIENSSDLRKSKGKIDPNDFGNFFQLATNMIVNLQATIESLANRLIPMETEFIGRDGEKFEPSLFHKINIVLPEIKGLKFKTKYGKQNNFIRQLIDLRNEIIHLKPAGEINSAYKEVYRRMISFKYTETLNAVRSFVDFYENGLIEECSCQKEFYYTIASLE